MAVIEHFEPREYQKIAADFLLSNPRCGLFAVPGMGKTSTTYMLLDWLMMAGSNFFPALVIAPKRVALQVWPFEVKKWDAFCDLKVIPVLGSTREREDALLRRGDVYVINYDNLQWLVNRFKNKWPFRIVICDESTKLKNFRLNKQGGARAGALGEIVDKTGRWINLTGTPCPNGLKDLWGQMWFIDKGSRLGRTYTDFMDRWFRMDIYTKKIQPLRYAQEEIHSAIADCTLALRAEDWFDIEKPKFVERPIDLPAEARAKYDSMEDTYWMEVGDRFKTDIEAMNAMVKSLKLIQTASGMVYDAAKVPHEIHDLKLEELESIRDEMGGENLLVVYHFKADRDRILKRFPEARTLDDKSTEDEWNAGKIPMLLVHPQSAGHGLNLQYGGRTVIFFTNTWNLEYRQQVIERLGPTRQAQSGFKRTVLIYDIIARETIDIEVMMTLTGKASVQDALMRARARSKGEIFVPSQIVIPENELFADLI